MRGISPVPWNSPSSANRDCVVTMEDMRSFVSFGSHHPANGRPIRTSLKRATALQQEHAGQNPEGRHVEAEFLHLAILPRLAACGNSSDEGHRNSVGPPSKERGLPRSAAMIRMAWPPSSCPAKPAAAPRASRVAV